MVVVGVPRVITLTLSSSYYNQEYIVVIMHQAGTGEQAGGTGVQ